MATLHREWVERYVATLHREWVERYVATLLESGWRGMWQPYIESG